MTETRFRLLMAFFLCAAIAMLTLSEISIAQARTDEPGPGCRSLHAEMSGFPGPFAGAPHDRQLPPPALGMPAWLSSLQLLDLTDVQQDKMFALAHEQAPLIREQLKMADKARDALHQLALAQPFDKAQAQRVAQNQADAMARVALLHAELEASIRALLTPEQVQQLDRPEPCPQRPAP